MKYKAKEDRDYTRVRLKIDGGYDKHGDVFVIARPLTGSVSFPVKTFDNAKTRGQFIEEFTFFRYGGQCPSWHSVLFANDCFSDEEKYSDTLKGENYTSERGKAYVLQLIASGELVAHYTGSWIPPGDRNHHLPWPKSSAKEELLPVTHQPYTLGPHEEPGYVPPVETSTTPDEDEEVVPDSKLFRSSEGLKTYWDDYYSSVGREAEDFTSLSRAAQKRGINVVKGDYASYRKGTIKTGPDTKRWEFIEEFLHHKVETEGAFKPTRDALKKELKLNRIKQIGRVSEEIAVKQWILSKPKLLKLDQPTQTVLQKQIDQLKKHGVSDGY